MGKMEATIDKKIEYGDLADCHRGDHAELVATGDESYCPRCGVIVVDELGAGEKEDAPLKDAPSATPRPVTSWYRAEDGRLSMEGGGASASSSVRVRGLPTNGKSKPA